MEIYLIPPKDLRAPSGTVLYLLKLIYGLRISPLIWNDKLHKVLLVLGLRRSPYDTRFYYSTTKNVYILVFINDILIASTKEASSYLEQKLLQKLNITKF